MLRFLESDQIDRVKWDRCVSTSIAKHIYALSWYLDLVAEKWAGIVEDDYISVMPLPIRKKFGIKYVFQPAFTQQLGVFSRKTVNSKLLNDFINTIPSEIKYIDINLNFSNNYNHEKYIINNKINFELNLLSSYKRLKSAYSENTKRNIQRSIPFIEISEAVRISDLVRLKRESTFKKRSLTYYEWLNCFMHKLITNGYAKIIGASCNGQICAAALFVFFGKRIYYLIPASNDLGKKRRAMFAIVDHCIQTYSEKDFILDFEGSNISGIARFFNGFGARTLTYPSIKINRLPFCLHLLKK